MVEVAIEHSGKNISTDTTAGPRIHKHTSWNRLSDYENRSTSGVWVWAHFKEHFAIYPAVATGSTGAKALRMAGQHSTLADIEEKHAHATREAAKHALSQTDEEGE